MISKSAHSLKVQQNKIGQASFRLKERDKYLFQACIGALKNKNKDRATVCANELSEVRKIVKFLYNVELAIERVILRLETMKELSDIVVDLKPALKMLENVSRQLFEVLPDVSSELSAVNDTISETLYATRLRADESIIPVNKTTQAGKEILSEVSDFLEQKLVENLPEPPVGPVAEKEVHVRQMVAIATACAQTVSHENVESEDISSQNLFSYKKSEIQEVTLKVEKPSLEDAVFEYVKRSKGEVDLSKCSIELDTSYQEVEKALKGLGEKGKIVIEQRR
jgi:division protein CdvB (Snf7/Vps24/ESCRT-III family)